VLLRHGHHVTVLSEEPEEHYAALGATVAVGSPYKLPVVEEVLGGRETAVFFGTVAPNVLIPKRRDLLAYDRFRREAVRVLISAALRQRTQLLIVISTTGVYGNQGDRIVDEKTPVQAPKLLQSFVDMEEQVREAGSFQGLRWLCLRIGMVYSARAWHTREVFSLVSRGHAPPLGAERGYVSPVHAEDVARAVEAAALRCPPNRVLNIVDDHPIRFGELLTAVAQHLGAKPPGAMPSFLLRLAIGKELYQVLKLSCRADNSLAKRLLGWRPRYPSILERLKDEIALWQSGPQMVKPAAKGKPEAAGGRPAGEPTSSGEGEHRGTA